MDPFFGLLFLIFIVFACVYIKLDSIFGTTKIEKKEDNVIYGTPNKGTFEVRLPKKIEYDIEFMVDVKVQNWLAGTIKGTNFVGMISNWS